MLRGVLTLVAWKRCYLLFTMTAYGTLHLAEPDGGLTKNDAIGTWDYELDEDRQQRDFLLNFKAEAWKFGTGYKRRNIRLTRLSLDCYYSLKPLLVLFPCDKTQELMHMPRMTTQSEA